MQAGFSIAHNEVKRTKFDEVGMFVIIKLLALNKFAAIHMT